MNKLIAVLIITAILISTFASIVPANAALTNLYDVSIASADGYGGIYCANIRGGRGPRITGNGQYLYSATFYMGAEVDASGTLRAGLVNGTAAGSGAPWENSTNSVAVATLNSLDSTPTEYDEYGAVTFYFDGDVQLVNASTYYVVVYNEITGNVKYWYMAGMSAGAEVFTTTWINGWTLNSGDEQCGLIITTDSPGAEPTPTPSATATTAPTTSTTTLINTFVDYLVPLMLFLVPALILGYLTHWAKWPILIGLAIGAGLTYLFLGTQYLWLVILVVIGIGASAYQSTRGG